MELPPSQVTRAVVQRYVHLLGRYKDDLGDRPLILANGTFFPDAFEGNDESLYLLATRMQEHAGMGDIPLKCNIVGSGASSQAAGGCGTGACAVPQTGTGMPRLIDEGESWTLQVPEAELRHPVALTTNLARSLAFIFLVETQGDGEHLEPPVDVTADFIAVALGFGTLMLQGSYIYAKSCGGPQIASVTKVELPELAVAVALFASLGGHQIAPALKTLDVTQRSVLSEAARLLKRNKILVDRIRQNPALVARSDFKLSESSSVFGDLFNKWGARRPQSGGLPTIDANMDLEEVEALLIDMPPSSRAGRTDPPPPLNREKDELKGLVTDALRHSRI